MRHVRYVKRKILHGKRKHILLLIVIVLLLFSILPIILLSDYSEQNKLYKKEEIPESPPFPIDIVYTWSGSSHSVFELRYSLRSIFKYIKWYRNIYIVTKKLNSNNWPSWLLRDITNTNLIIIDQCTLFINKSNCIDNHNSEAFEINLHHIDGLSTHYIYLNDDFFIGNTIPYSYFFNLNKSISQISFSNYYFNLYYNYIDSLVRSSSALYSCLYTNKNRRKLKTINKLKELNDNNELPDLSNSYIASVLEHLPRAYNRNILYALENKYKKWFEIIESHKSRFRSCDSKKTGTGDESIYHIYLRYLFNNQLKNNNYLYIFKENEYNEYKHEIGYSYFKWDCMGYPQFNDYIFGFNYNNSFINKLRNSVCYDNYYHLWMKTAHQLTIPSVKYYLNLMLTVKPYTFCIQDNWVNAPKSIQPILLQMVLKFYRTYFDIIPPWENYTAPNDVYGLDDFLN